MRGLFYFRSNRFLSIEVRISRKRDIKFLVAGYIGWATKEFPMYLVRAFIRDDRGATAIEYGLIAAGISIAIIGVVNTLGTNLSGIFSSVSSALGG